MLFGPTAASGAALAAGFRWRSCFLVLLDQTAHRIGRLRAFADPIFDPIELQRAVVPGLLRIVGADDLDKFSVARAAAVGHDDLVIRAIHRAFSA